MTVEPTHEELGNPLLIDDKYSIRELIDIKRLRKTFDKFSLATGFTTGFLVPLYFEWVARSK